MHFYGLKQGADIVAIKSFKSRALKRLYLKGDASKVQAKHASKLKRQLARLNKSRVVADMNLPGYRLHQLKGFDNRWAVTVDENYSDLRFCCWGMLMSSIMRTITNENA
ncbi:MAG: type II toxin-antitoxin system RelE/ParE family toxin [Cyanobacteria bacterium J06627_28]